MFVVDTCVLLYAANTASPEHTICRQHLDRWRSESLPWHVTWGILYEFLRVSTHPRVFERPWSIQAAWTFVEGILSSPGVSLLQETERHADIARQVLSGRPPVSGNLVLHARTAILMREHGVRRIYTRDTAFHVFTFLEALDPLT